VTWTLLHAGHQVSWRSWSLEPSVLLIALGIAGLYISGIGTRPAPWRVASFFAGWSLMLLALVSPLDAAAHGLLAMHMLQHVALTTLGPPLILLGLIPDMVRPVLRWRPASRAFDVATSPFVAGPLFLLNMWLWHVPFLYGAALDHLGAHVVMHVAFMGTGLLFWWPVIQPLPERRGAGDWGRLLYLFVSGGPMGILALVLLASPNVLYSYYEAGPGLWGVAPLTDQQLAGVVMGVLGESAAFLGFTLLFLKAMSQSAEEDSPPAPSFRPPA
jgi:cytochrome c oxidase assembly factor CtaG